LKMRTLSLLTLLCLVLGATAFAGNLYTNGPTNGTNDAYFIDVYIVSDSFPIAPGVDPNGFDIALWVPAGATPIGAVWALGSTSFGDDVGTGGGDWQGKTLLCSNGGTINGGPCGGGFGYDVYQIYVGVGEVNVGADDWLTLTGATDNFGGRDAWDVNSGPSAAFHNLLGAVPSESFTIVGGTTRTTTTCGGCGAPEPSSILLFASGLLALAGKVRHRLNR
jgi:hypothetical protein